MTFKQMMFDGAQLRILNVYIRYSIAISSTASSYLAFNSSRNQFDNTVNYTMCAEPNQSISDSVITFSRTENNGVFARESAIQSTTTISAEIQLIFFSFYKKNKPLNADSHCGCSTNLSMCVHVQAASSRWYQN